jgi:hypothetical protein
MQQRSTILVARKLVASVPSYCLAYQLYIISIKNFESSSSKIIFIYNTQLYGGIKTKGYIYIYVE